MVIYTNLLSKYNIDLFLDENIQEKIDEELNRTVDIVNKNEKKNKVVVIYYYQKDMLIWMILEKMMIK